MSDSNSLINEKYRASSSHVQELINDLSKYVNIAVSDSQRNENEIDRLQTLLENLNQKFFSLQQSSIDMTSRTCEMKIIEDLFTSEVSSLKQTVHDTISSSSDGTHIWKITNVREKIGMYEPFDYRTE